MKKVYPKIETTFQPINHNEYAIYTGTNDYSSLNITYTNPRRPEFVIGYEVVSLDDYFAMNVSAHYFNIGIGYSSLRTSLAEKCMSQGPIPIALRSESSIQYNCKEIGAVLCEHVTLTSNVSIGRFCPSKRILLL